MKVYMGLWNYLLTNQLALFPSFQNENKKTQREDQEIENNNITKTTMITLWESQKQEL